MISEGSAFLDRSGRVVVADQAFRRLLGLADADPSGALRARALEDPALSAFLAGSGPDRLAVDAGAAGYELWRVPCDDGALLHVAPAGGALPAPALELAAQAIALAGLAGSIAHEVKNPLNAMALQLALLGDKIGTASDALASACAGNLGSLKNQIGRIDELVRRYVDVADPTPASGFDAGALLADAVTLFGHEGRRRRLALSCEAAAGTVRAAGDPSRAARLLLGLLWRSLAGTPEGGRLVARATPSGDEAVLSLEHADHGVSPMGWLGPVVAAGAAQMGGRLEESRRQGVVRAALVLPKERPL